MFEGWRRVIMQAKPAGVKPPVVKYQAEYIPLTSSITATAVRMVVLVCWLDDQYGRYAYYDILPVVALQVSVRRRFGRTKRRDRDYLDPPTDVRSAKRQGWSNDGFEQVTEALICDREWGLVAHDAPMVRHPREQRLLVSAPWPVEQDEGRLYQALVDAHFWLTEDAGWDAGTYGQQRVDWYALPPRDRRDVERN